MRKLMILVAMIAGFMGQKELGTELDYNYAEEQPVVTEEVCGLVEYQTDGDTIVIYSDDSSILINRQDNEYIMWIPETEDLEHHYNSEDELMTAIEAYHGPVSDLTYPEGSILNPNGYVNVELELDKVDEDVLELLASTGLKIYYDDDYITMCESQSGHGIAGLYNTHSNFIVMREDWKNINTALLHEIGHALDFNLGLRYNQTLIDSYMNQEVVFSHNSDYYYSCVEEYIAESIEYYYNDLLPQDTAIYQELHYILGE